uniref:Sulfotransferase n=1 Tax=Haptolina ericina TaxID=156174 RepID=A0A6T9LWR7_9EUKA|mmetsp:Transcript_63880/g.142598  ORF Transcript_63880/g.142598 Transcript_63880/m.142598 type:complete len:240 (+) Transcript_63880:1307-2026(+)
MVSALGSQGRVLYDRHVLYVDFPRFGLPQPSYINMVRDPLAMQLSAYYFWRECFCVARQPFCVSALSQMQGDGDHQIRSMRHICSMGIDDVYAQVDPQPTVGLMTRWFCGQDPVCKAPDPQPHTQRHLALERAVHHIRMMYVWVGVLERLEESLRLLSWVLPSFFGGMATSQIAIENENDLKLYAFANRLLDCRLSRCGKERMRWSAHVHNGEHGAQEPHAGPHFFANANIAAKRMLDG